MRLQFWLLLPLLIFSLTKILRYGKEHVLPKNYVFDHKELQALSQAMLAEVGPEATPNEKFENLYVKIKERYGDYIEEYNYDDWMFNNAGGAMVS